MEAEVILSNFSAVGEKLKISALEKNKAKTKIYFFQN